MKKLLLFFIFFSFYTILYSVPKMSEWDGVSYAVKDYLKKNANDPKSIKYIECSIMLKLSNGWYSQKVKFRGKNALGALVINEFYFFIKGEDFNAVVVKVATYQEADEFIKSNNLKIIGKYNSDGTKIP